MNKTMLLSSGNFKVPRAFLFQVVLVLCALGVIVHLQSHISIDSKKNVRIFANAETLDHLVLGYKFITADLLWLRVIQDIDYKDPGGSNKGWVYSLLDTITTLDPRYAMVYRSGVTVLSVVVRDRVGAGLLFDRGVKAIPDNWEIAYKAGYHYMFELKDCRHAATLFQQAAENGAPPWVHALASRLYAKSGQYQIARSILQDGLEKSKGTAYHIEFQKRIDQLEASYRDPNNKVLIEGLNCKVN